MARSVFCLHFGDVEGLLGDGDGLREVAGLGVHGGEHLQDGGLAVAGEFRGGLELGESFRKSAGGGKGAAQVVVAFGGARRESDGLLQFGDGLVHFAFAGEDDAVDVVAVGVLGRDLHALRELLDGFLAMAGDFEQMAEVDVRGAVVGVECDGLLDLCHRFVEAASFSQSAAQVVVRLRTVVVHGERLVVGGDGVAGLAAGGQRHAHVVPGARVGGILVGGDFPRGHGVRVFVRILQLLREVEFAIEVDGGRIDMVETFRAEVDELGNIDCAIGGSGVFNDDRRTGMALVVNVREIEMRVERRALRREGQPVAVGIERVPGVHHAAGSTQADALRRLRRARCRACCRGA